MTADVNPLGEREPDHTTDTAVSTGTADPASATTQAMNPTEAKLLDVALTLFASQGYDATSVRQIIEATGVTRPVLYYYCDNKEDLFRRVVQWKHEDAYRTLDAILAATDSAVEQLRILIRGTFAFCQADPRVPQLMFQTTYGPPLSSLAAFMQSLATSRFAVIMGVMQRGLDAGELQGGDAASLALVFCSLTDHHANALSRQPDTVKRLTEARADALLNIFLAGLGTSACVDQPRLPALGDNP